jgi:hypothetical protein
MQQEADKLISRKEAMHLLHIASHTTFARLVAQRKILAMRPTGSKGKMLFWKSEILRYLEECRDD